MKKLTALFPFRNKVRILIVEENPIIQAVFKEMLSILGLKADFVSDGKSALFSYASIYHLILMDIEMPYLNGIEVSQLIRSFEKNHHLSQVPIVAITSHFNDNPKYRKKCQKAGMNDCYGKPTLIQLEKIILNYVLPQFSTSALTTHSGKKPFAYENLLVSEYG